VKRQLFFLRIYVSIFAIYLVFNFSTLAADHEYWFHSNGNYKAEKYSTLNSIHQTNLDQLKPAWVYNSGHVTLTRNTVQTTPVFTGRSLITTSLDGNVIAINPKSGKEKWRIKLPKPAGRRGIVFKQLKSPTLFVTTGKGVYAINENTGKVDPSIGLTGKFDTVLSLQPPIVTDDSVIIATNWFGVKSFDLQTGRQKWNTVFKSGNIIPRTWSGLSYDNETGVLFVVTSNPGSIVGVNRKGEKDFSTSLIAIDSKTGRIIWSFQEVVHDLWDIELVGPPIVLDITQKGKTRKAVYAFSKTGNIVALDRLTGKPIFPNSYKNITVQKSDLKGENNAPTQKQFLRPTPVSTTVFDKEIDLKGINGERREYINFKMRHSRTGFFVPPSLNYDVVMFGLGGGAEWPGGAFDKRNNQIILPSNRYPWILRLYYSDNMFSYINKKIKKFNLSDSSAKAPPNHKERLSTGEPCSSCHSPKKARWDAGKDFSDTDFSLGEEIYHKLNLFKGSGLYRENCASCHGMARQGSFEHETFGDGYAPPLVGITLTKKKYSLDSVRDFKRNHIYTSEKINISEPELEEIKSYFSSIDNFLTKWDLLTVNGKWQLLLDQDNLPASTTPWGRLTAIDVNSGKINWQIPFGQRESSESDNIGPGDINFGGVLATASGIAFATGTPDKMLRAYDSQSGKELWRNQLPYAGSAPPMTFMYKGCQYVVATATGGRFVGFEEWQGDSTVAYRLDGCE
jgi:quinoprotein glucose dehydrogenase